MKPWILRIICKNDKDFVLKSRNFLQFTACSNCGKFFSPPIAKAVKGSLTCFILVMHHYLRQLTVFSDILTACYYGLRISLRSAGLLALLSFFLCLGWQLAVKRSPNRLRLMLGTFYVGLLSLLFYAGCLIMSNFLWVLTN